MLDAIILRAPAPEIRLQSGRKLTPSDSIGGANHGGAPQVDRALMQYYSANILSVNRFVDFSYEKPRKITQMFMAERYFEFSGIQVGRLLKVFMDLESPWERMDSTASAACRMV